MHIPDIYIYIYIDIDVKCKHIAGVNNTTADHLSRNNLVVLLSTLTGSSSTKSNPTTTTPDIRSGSPRLDISSIQVAVQRYYQNGLATATQRC